MARKANSTPKTAPERKARTEAKAPVASKSVAWVKKDGEWVKVTR